MHFCVAMVQKTAAPNDPDANLHTALACITQAHAVGADLVLFPELWSHAYAPPFAYAFEQPHDPKFSVERRAWLHSAVAIDSPYVQTLQAAAKEHNIGVAATFLCKCGADAQNTAIIIGREGQILLQYDKVHTCDFSLESLLKSGTEFPVCEFDGIRLGVMICFDREFPESARLLMIHGAELILVPNACDMNPARLQQLSTRAFENMTGVAMANYPAPDWGRSCAFSPIVFDDNGRYVENTIAMAGETEEAIVLARFNMDAIRNYRKNEVWGNAYRKPGSYGDLL